MLELDFYAISGHRYQFIETGLITDYLKQLGEVIRQEQVLIVI